MLLIWTQRARENRLHIMSYIAQFDVDAVQRISENLKIASESLLDFPKKGHLGLIPNTLELLVRPHYRLIYRLNEDVIQILAVIDNAQDITQIVADD